MLQQKLREACKATTAHGLPHLVSSKPIFIRVVWLLLFLFFMCLFLRGLAGFVVKLNSRQVTSSLDAGSVRFQFPDVYACFESPVSGTYAVNMNDSVIERFNASMAEVGRIYDAIGRKAFGNSTSESEINDRLKKPYSNFFVPSLPFRLLADFLSQRPEQSVLSSTALLVNENGTLEATPVSFSNFYHPTLMRCFRWSSEASSAVASIQQRGSLTISLFTDIYDGKSIPSLNGNSIVSPVYVGEGGEPLQLPVSAWTLSETDGSKPSRRSGVRIFLMPAGEYPTDFGTSFLLEPGQHYQVEVSMHEELHNPDQFSCVSKPEQVQFFNPYASEPYSHRYSYSYCYYNEYNKAAVPIFNHSIQGTPITWPLRHAQYCLNMSSPPNFLEFLTKLLISPSSVKVPQEVNLNAVATSNCKNQDLCSRLIYDARISSAKWPKPASLGPFLRTTVAMARDAAMSRGLSVPALDYLVNASSENSNISKDATDFANANLLKLEIKPRRMDCDRVTFAIQYGFENFVADIGGIMGIYLGMSLLTICELFDLIAELLFIKVSTSKSRKTPAISSSSESSVKQRRLGWS